MTNSAIEAFVQRLQLHLEKEQAAIRKILGEEKEMEHIERCRFEQAIDDRTHAIDLAWELYRDEVQG